MLDDIKPPRGFGGGWKQQKHSPKLDSPKSPGKRTAETPKIADETIEVPDEPPQKPISEKKKAGRWWHVFSYRHSHLSRRRWALLAVILLAFIGAGGFGAYKLYKTVSKLPPQKAAAKIVRPPKPAIEPSRLTGLPVSPELNKRPVTGVMIENSPDARPQSGLKDAGIVFEAIAEGGITRFLALYEDAQPDYIGPVRSARPYYLDFALAFDASLAHVGGSPEALAQIRSLGVADLDQFANGQYYTRIKSRYAPHNVYTSSANLDAINAKIGHTSSTFTSWARKKDQPLATPTARSIDLAVSSFLYNPHYEYDAVSNSYKRSEGGQPHVDERTNSQLTPKVVVALVMNYSIAGDRIHSVYDTVGSGHMYIFQDGGVTEGTWQKADRKAQFSFTDANGATIRFNSGQTWVTLVKDTAAVTYKP